MNDDLEQLKRFILEYAKFTFPRDLFNYRGEKVSIGCMTIIDLGHNDETDVNCYKVSFYESVYLVEISSLEESIDYEGGSIVPEVVGFYELEKLES